MKSTRRKARLALLAAAALASPSPAAALNFTVIYDPTDPNGVDPCTADPDFKVCPNGVPETQKMLAALEAATDYWADAIEDDHNITILAAWFDPAFGSKPEASIIDTDADGRALTARIRISPTLNYFYDPTPADDDEFNMRPGLFRTLHPNERIEAFSVEPIMAHHDAVELSNIGLFETSMGVDLLSVALHEVGHVVGLSRERDQCDGANPVYTTSADQTGVSFVFDAYKFTDDKGMAQTDCNHLALGGVAACKPMPSDDTLSSDPSTSPGLTIQECTAHQAMMWAAIYPGSRTRPSTIDILAASLAESWQEIDFPRKYSLASGLWQNASQWFGPRAPDGGDDVFLANRTATSITVNSNSYARSTTIDEGNILEIDGANLILSRSLRMTRVGAGIGPIVVVPPPPDDPGDIGVPVIPATLRLSNNGGLQARDVINLGRIEGAGVVGVTRRFSNSAIVRADGGLLKLTTPPPGGVIIDPPIVDLDGPDPDSYTARLIARNGDLAVSAIPNGAYLGRAEIGPGRKMSFSEGFTQAFSSQPAKRLVIDNGTLAGIVTLGGVVELEGIAGIEGQATLTPGARILYEAAGQQPGAEADLLFVDGDIALAGTLILTLEGGFKPTLGLVLSMVQANGEISGAFTSYQLPDISGKGVAWNIVQNDQNVLLSVVFDPDEVMSDVNGDGMVDFLDLLVILLGFGPCPPQPADCPADLNGDGGVDFTDVAFWLAAQ